LVLLGHGRNEQESTRNGLLLFINNVDLQVGKLLSVEGNSDQVVAFLLEGRVQLISFLFSSDVVFVGVQIRAKLESSIVFMGGFNQSVLAFRNVFIKDRKSPVLDGGLNGSDEDEALSDFQLSFFRIEDTGFTNIKLDLGRVEQEVLDELFSFSGELSLGFGFNGDLRIGRNIIVVGESMKSIFSLGVLETKEVTFFSAVNSQANVDIFNDELDKSVIGGRDDLVTGNNFTTDQETDRFKDNSGFVIGIHGEFRFLELVASIRDDLVSSSSINAVRVGGGLKLGFSSLTIRRDDSDFKRARSLVLEGEASLFKGQIGDVTVGKVNSLFFVFPAEVGVFDRYSIRAREDLFKSKLVLVQRNSLLVTISRSQDDSGLFNLRSLDVSEESNFTFDE